MKKLLALMFSLSLLTGCSYFGGDDAVEAMDKDGDTIMEVEAMEEDTPESVDAEVEALMEEEASLDAELDALENEEL